MIVYGKNACIEALNNLNLSINKVLLQKGVKGDEIDKIMRLTKKRGLRYTFVASEVIIKLSGSKNNQGVVIDCTEFVYSSLQDVIKNAKEKDERLLIVVCDEITDPHNLGAIIRSAECAGATCVVISKDHSAQVTETVFKTSAGAVSNIDVCQVVNIVNTLEYLKSNGIWVFGLEANGENIYKSNLKSDIAIVVGSEGFGLRRLVKDTCDNILSIPMRGKTNSLNASVAAGVAIMEANRQQYNVD